MSVKSVRAPDSPVLIAAGMALLLLAALGIGTAVANPIHHRIPIIILAEAAIRDAFFGIALLYVAFRRSQFAGATAVIIAIFIMFGVVFDVVVPVAAWRLPHVTWWTAIDLVTAGSLVWSSIFPWDRTANKPALFCMVVTFGALTVVLGTLAVLVGI